MLKMILEMNTSTGQANNIIAAKKDKTDIMKYIAGNPADILPESVWFFMQAFILEYNDIFKPQ